MADLLTYLAIGLFIVTLGPPMVSALVDLYDKRLAGFTDWFIWIFVIGGFGIIIAAGYQLFRSAPRTAIDLYIIGVLIATLVAEGVVAFLSYQTHRIRQRIIDTHPV